MLNWFKSFSPAASQVNNEAKQESTVVWIHGANQSSFSFNYLRLKCNFQNEYLVNYDSMNRFYHNLDIITEELKDLDSVFVVGHSLGGLYALHLTQRINVVGGVSISTPFRGSSTADWAKYVVPNYPLFRDIGRKAPPVQDSFNITLDIPWIQIVSVAGSAPYHNGPNDGVVTVASMEHREDMEKVQVNHTHYEVMCSDEVAELIKTCYVESQTL
jgi:pimeloyl-ACP methyl ester carboxylesterase